MHSTYPTHLIRLDLIAVTVCGEDNRASDAPHYAVCFTAFPLLPLLPPDILPHIGLYNPPPRLRRDEIPLVISNFRLSVNEAFSLF